MRLTILKKQFYNPAQLFVGSFIFLVLLGCVSLKLPFATYKHLSWIDALFTSTSAVCVTGLVVVDTASHFTIWGKLIIMTLIQAGGIGILSFAGLFTYFFKGGSSYGNQLAIGSFSNVDRLGEVFVILKRTIYITFSIEIVGAIGIYTVVGDEVGTSVYERIFFAVFHSVSSFCNAGFSTLPKGLMDNSVVVNYAFQLVIAIIYIFGGLGFPIVINVLKYLKHLFNRIRRKWTLKENYYRPWVMTINSKINLITTGIISIFATVVIFFAESGNVLSAHSGFGKLVMAFATATTPRTAGFNSVDFAQLHFYTILFIIVLMWIGASPSSTGGGIKTSTIALAFLNTLSLAKGKDRTEVFRREIAQVSINRAFATMFLSLVAIGCGILCIGFMEPGKPLVDISFECFSAYSTVGLSLKGSHLWTEGSKIVLILLMFVGRVTMLSLLIGLVKKVKHTHYRYAPEELTIS